EAKEHLSFHTPGHKRGKWDITELSFSDNLFNPTGVLKAAQEDIARILGAEKSFILTDGSTCGVLSMIYASGVKKLLFSKAAHQSVYNACKLLHIEPITLPVTYQNGIPQQPTTAEIAQAVEQYAPDGVLLTSPDYYGNIADYQGVKAVCLGHGIPLLCDGAHGGHLHGEPLYAGNYCDMWVDGVHKSLPAITQGAVVSANKKYAARLEEGVKIFRTTSPNYVIMASVEYAVKYPKNPEITAKSAEIKQKFAAYSNADWSKIVISYGNNAVKVNEYLEAEGIFSEFCDGENIMFYLSPATDMESLKRLEAALSELTPLQRKTKHEAPMPALKEGERTKTTALVPLQESKGYTAATSAGLFPPCIPLINEGEVITERQIERLQNAKNSYGLTEGKVLVYIK
ncbi:MAG: aminotransferase class I/II-fold pyridoxal phosphate-dependent enzyme, partial [Clostridia bacterium]|nr:aminotransferase class I/II-fold pyridoxal phosphate-dependent enzyme [Clostridia bacterium]